jgi:hypothetical protein
MSSQITIIIIFIIIVFEIHLASPAKEPETWAPGYDCRAPPGRVLDASTGL